MGPIDSELLSTATAIAQTSHTTILELSRLHLLTRNIFYISLTHSLSQRSAHLQPVKSWSSAQIQFRSLTTEPEPQKIPTIVSSVTSPATNTMCLITPVPAFRVCGKCYFSSPADLNLAKCPSCHVYQLKVKEQRVLQPRSSQHVGLYQEKKSFITPGYQVFAQVFTNTAGTLVMPERLDPKFYSEVIPRPYKIRMELLLWLTISIQVPSL